MISLLADRAHAVDGGARSSAPFAHLGMYPFESLRTAWDQLYRAAAGEVIGAPDELRWDLDARDTWLSPRLQLGMTCGWPLVTELLHRVRVIGTFAYGVDGVVGHTYRSVIIARDSVTIADLANGTLAINSSDSLSGYVSMISVLPDARTTWSGETLETGDHLASIDAVRDGRADIASIDALTWAYIRRDAPRSLHGLVVIDRGPLVPHLPLIAHRDTTDREVAAWRTALADAVRSPALAGALAALLIHGFVALDADDYETALAPLRRIGT